jgi:hypothetical protein
MMWSDDPVNGTTARLLTPQSSYFLGVSIVQISIFLQAAGISGDETESTHCISQNGLTSAMKEFAVVVLSLAVLDSSGAFAQVKTRAEVS